MHKITTFDSLERSMRQGLDHAAETLAMLSARAEFAAPYLNANDEQRERLTQLVDALRSHTKRLRRSSRKVGRRLERIAASTGPAASMGDKPAGDQPIGGHVDPRVRTEGDGPIVQLIVPRGTQIEAEFAE